MSNLISFNVSVCFPHQTHQERSVHVALPPYLVRGVKRNDVRLKINIKYIQISIEICIDVCCKMD